MERKDWEKTIYLVVGFLPLTIDIYTDIDEMNNDSL